MGLPNLKLRGGSYHWRRKITVSGADLPLCLSLNTGNVKRARRIADQLGAAVEKLRMAYGQSTGMGPDQLKRVFSDALRWQLQRILEDQAGSTAPLGEHASVNSLYAEAWAFLGRNGVDALWTLDEHDRLVAAGWGPERAKAVANLVFTFQTGGPVSRTQIDSYSEAVGIDASRDNVERIARTIWPARAAAYYEATKRLPAADDGKAQWINDALADDAPFAFDQIARPNTPPIVAEVAPSDKAPPSDLDVDRPSPAVVQLFPKKLLLEAAEECVVAYLKADAWDTVSARQVRTALRLFDHAAGGGVFIEDLEQSNVRAFSDLCRALPNRWGRTTAGRAGGIPASLVRAATMPPADVGLGQTTINKHVTWIEAVLAHAAGDEDDDQGYRPTKPLSFKPVRAGIGKTSRKQRKRDRDKRANWTKQEVAHLLSAPVWTGAAGIDNRLTPGDEIIHDAWYWLPLMLPLYGGRSSELAGLALTEVHERDGIPYFLIDYTEDRSLKNIQSIRRLPIHPELVRLGFVEYITALRDAGCTMLFPEMNPPHSDSFSGTFYRTIFKKWRRWGFPNGTPWRYRQGGAWKDKDVHSFRGLATSMLKGHVMDSVRCDIFGHEGETETARTYDEEAELGVKLAALHLLTPLTKHILPTLPIRIRPVDRLRFGSRREKTKASRAPAR